MIPTTRGEHRLPTRNRETGKVRTPLWCHECQRDFSAVLDYDCTGNHVIFCPHCRHEHCRVIEEGVVTSDRWDSRNGASGAVWFPVTSASATNTLNTYYISSTTNALNRQFLAQSWNATSRF
jgi:hypothetical protein